jgi:hypothetical protein
MLVCAYRHAGVKYSCSPLEVDTIAVTSHRKIEKLFNQFSVISCLIGKEKIPWLTFDVEPTEDASCDDIVYTYTISSKTCWKPMQVLITTPSIAGNSLGAQYTGLGDRRIENEALWKNQTAICR